VRNPFRRRQRREAERRAARNAVAQQSAANELPVELQQLVATAQNAKAIEDLIRGGRFERATAQQVHGAISWLVSMRQACEQRVEAHPEFARWFPEAAADKAAREEARNKVGLVGPNGERIER